MKPSWVLTVGAIVVSLFLIPGSLTYLFTVHGPPAGENVMVALGLIAMCPGILMGATALWVAAQG